MRERSQEILSDGTVTEGEAKALQEWFPTTRMSENWFGTALVDGVDGVLADGEMDEEERASLIEALELRANAQE